jgi:hypothetical protein
MGDWWQVTAPATIADFRRFPRNPPIFIDGNHKAHSESLMEYSQDVPFCRTLLLNDQGLIGLQAHHRVSPIQVGVIIDTHSPKMKSATKVDS